MIWFSLFIGIVVLALLYVRIAPIEARKVDQPVQRDADSDGQGYCMRVIADQGQTLAQVDAALRALPRTTVVAGSPEAGRITYVTRSKWIGFPDYTTVEQHDGQIRLFARLRFGQSDFGVNRARLTHVIDKVSA